MCEHLKQEGQSSLIKDVDDGCVVVLYTIVCSDCYKAINGYSLDIYTPKPKDIANNGQEKLF